MPLGTKVGLGVGLSLRDIVLDGDPAPPPAISVKGHTSTPNFRSVLAKRQDGL